MLSRPVALIGAVIAVIVATGPTTGTGTVRARAAGTVHYGTPAGNLPTHINADGTAVLPDGRLLTPAGRTVSTDLVPLNAVVSHDGRRVYVSDEGEDNTPRGSGDATFNRFISVVDTTTMLRTRIEDDALQAGLAESPDGRELYASEGATNTMGVFTVTPTGLKRAASISLGAHDFPWGMALSPDGHYAYLAAFIGNYVDVVDTRSRTLVAQVATGEFPYAVAVSADGGSLFVSNMGVYNTEAPFDHAGTPAPPVAAPPATAVGYNMPQSSSVWTYSLVSPAAPTVTMKTRIGADVNGYDVLSGSLPGALALSPDGATVAVTASNNDLVALLDAHSGKVRRTFDLRLVSGGPTGDQPNAVAWSPDGARLYVAEGGRNAVAVVDARVGSVLGRIPTGWYPSAVTVSGDGNRLYITSAKGLGTGANAGLATGPTANNDHYPGYIGSLLHGTLQSVDLGQCAALTELSAEVDRNNGIGAPTSAVQPGDAVVPTVAGSPSPVIRHVVFVLKENRSYDQILGDLPGSERSQALAAYSGNVTPNEHAVATTFASADNFYTTSQSSTDGHFLYGTGQENEFDQKTVPSTQANVFQGSAGGIVNTSVENLPIGGFLWHNAARSGVSTRIYGEAASLIGLGPNNTAIPAIDVTNPTAVGALQNSLVTVSPTYPTQLQAGADEQRADDIQRELAAFDRIGTMPTFSYLVLPDDHTDGATPGQPTPSTYISTNDHALGRIVDAYSHSSFWNDTAIFVTEDDTQGGQDHVDAQRTVLLAAGPYARHGYISHVHHSTPALVHTIDLLIGAAPTSMQEMLATPMTDLLQSAPQVEPRFTALARQVGDSTNPTAAAALNADQRLAAELQARVPAGVDRGGALLPIVLELEHRGAVAAGEPGLPPTPAVIEHRLTQGDVPLRRVSVAASCPGSVLTAGQAGAPPGSIASPVTGAPAAAVAPVAALLVVGFAVLIGAGGRRGRRADRGMSDG